MAGPQKNRQIPITRGTQIELANSNAYEAAAAMLSSTEEEEEVTVVDVSSSAAPKQATATAATPKQDTAVNGSSKAGATERWGDGALSSFDALGSADAPDVVNTYGAMKQAVTNAGTCAGL